MIWETLIKWLTGRASIEDARRKELARERQARYYRKKRARK